jgi:hypothetical protein
LRPIDGGIHFEEQSEPPSMQCHEVWFIGEHVWVMVQSWSMLHVSSAVRQASVCSLHTGSLQNPHEPLAQSSFVLHLVPWRQYE